MAGNESILHAHTGDWLEVQGRPGRPGRRGEIVEVLGEPGHQRFRVRWELAHESIFFATEAATIVPAPEAPGGEGAQRRSDDA
jgi:hypothetical protein